MASIIELNGDDLALLKQLEFKILKEFDRICRKHSLKYSLSGGTLIGAIRHKGFIPWDDDIDVIMLRNDYEKFLNIAKQELDMNEFAIANYDEDLGYGEPFTKLELKNTIFKEFFVGNSEIRLSGVFVDIFPLDNAPDDSLKRAMHRFKNYELRKRILIKCGYDFNKAGIKKFLYSLLKITTLRSKESLVAAYKRNALKYNKIHTKDVVALSGTYGYVKETRPKDFFDEYIEVEFEGEKFFAFKQYDQELRRFFGDYMKLPSVEEQVSKHFVQALDLTYYGGRKAE